MSGRDDLLNIMREKRSDIARLKAESADGARAEKEAIDKANDQRASVLMDVINNHLRPLRERFENARDISQKINYEIVYYDKKKIAGVKIHMPGSNSRFIDISSEDIYAYVIIGKNKKDSGINIESINDVNVETIDLLIKDMISEQH